VNDDVGKQVDEVMSRIAAHRMATGRVHPRVTIEFYECVAEQCAEVADALREEHLDEDESE
jgi:hypothetical protein